MTFENVCPVKKQCRYPMLSHILSLVLGLALLLVTVAVWYLMYNHKAPGRHILESLSPSAYTM